MNTKTKIQSLILFSFIFSMMACSPSTKLTKTWTDPSVSASTFKPFTKVLVLARLKDETGNRMAEDKLVKQFKPGVAVQSYSYLNAGDTVEQVVDARLKKDGFDGLVYMEFKSVDKSISVQSSGYGGYGYYGYRYGGPSTTTVSEDKTYVVETSIFSLENGKMLWSGTTSTFNPSSLDKALDDIIEANKAQLKKQGLIKEVQ